ncbi:rRNA (guanine-N1)-methyltransferase [Marinobacter salinus]|uniref:rRNA (Guanine-N1)-methyltransferase n=1 Tax=Marinobacter salinus TaxID=1874317 RepID=A0A1D9GJ29_9GAMM|nr:methyltransferase domain-containing protein [Marinobacter salinus]AOY87652.1 rRNA (guanine-N1)-methyltransferase [Marinobacter salinus]
MTILPFDALACPLDGGRLQAIGKSWCCDAGHSFDVARQGYVHLLPVQNKRSKDPGDNKQMVAARQRFLNQGFYQPIAEAVNQAVLSDLPDKGTVNVLDAGCGDGYYLRFLASAVQTSQELALLGVDISKWAVLAAAKQNGGSRWVVGSNANLPVLPETLDRVLCLFGFPVYGEFARVLKPGGQIVQVDAGPGHLRELREVVYAELKAQKEQEQPAPGGFHYLGSERVQYDLVLHEKEQVADLLAMTPHLYRASAEGRARAEGLQSLTVSVDVLLRRYEKA